MVGATVGNVGRSALAIDRSRIALFAPLRGIVAAVCILTVGVNLGATELAISAAIGALFTGVLDLGEPYPMRARVMLWATLWCSLAAFTGTLVSEHLAWHLVVAALVALVSGFSGALGLHGGLVGLVSLVVFVIYSGTPVPSTGTGAKDAAVMALGGLFATSLALCAWPLRRFGGTRASVAAAYRTLGLAWQPGTGVAATSPAVAAAVVRAADLVQKSHLGGEASNWLQQLVAQAERIRLTLVALSSQLDIEDVVESDSPSAGTVESQAALVAAVRRLTLAMSRAIAWEPARGKVAPAAAHLANTAARVEPGLAPRQRTLVQTLATQLREAAELVAEPWPRAQHRTVQEKSGTAGLRSRLVAHLSFDDLYMGHAIRLAVMIVMATGLAALIDRPHSYWIPLTVAWLAKPDLAGTVTRVPARVLGTMAGVVLVAVVVFPVSSQWWLVLWSGIGAAAVLAFLWANYSIAVAGITTFVLAAFALTGSDERADAMERVVYTLIAAVLVFAVALIRPRRSGRQVEVLIADTCSAMSEYAQSIRTGQAGAQQRANVLKARGSAATALAAAAVEPRWHRGPGELDPAIASLMLGDLVEATAALLTEELLTEEGIDDPAVWASFDDEIARLERELRALGVPVTVDEAPNAAGQRAAEHPITTPVRRARSRMHVD